MKKKIIKTVAIDDGSFHFKDRKGKASIILVFFHDAFLKKIKLGRITIDGLDSTEVIIDLLKDLDFDILMLNSITLAGFNIVDVDRIKKSYKKPILIVIKEKPNNKAVKEALRKHFKDWKYRWSLIRRLKKIYKTKTLENQPPLYFEVLSLKPKSAINIMKYYCLTCRIPEPLRVARLIAKESSPILNKFIA
ncbi:MAG: DUF99 family protein [Candidatus Bathyarchaeia archaeon]